MNNSYKLGIIIASVRPERKGKAVADWFETQVQKFPEFETVLIDLKEINLPFMDEPNHPRLGKYTKEHTFVWSRLINSCDAFVVVTPEYNYSYSPALKNAFDYLLIEWSKKPMGFVSYGGISGGTRAVQDIKLTVTTLEIMPLPIAVSIPFFSQHIDENGIFKGDEKLEHSSHAMLTSLSIWTKGLRKMREELA